MIDYLEQGRTMNGVYYAGELRRLRQEIVIPLFHTGPESHELTRIDKYLDSWLNRTQFVKVFTDSFSP